MHRLFFLAALLGLLGLAFACSSGPIGPVNSSPTDAYKSLYAAVKSKDTEQIKRNLTARTIEFGAFAAARNNTSPEKAYENGFTGTTFSESLPPIRDERISGEMGAIEVWNSKESKWEDLPFILEEGSWKLAVGEQFSGTYKSPGFGIDRKSKEAANAIGGNQVPIAVNSNSNPPRKLDLPGAAQNKP